MSLVGIGGAVAALRVGALEDRGVGYPALGAFGAIALLGMGITWFGAASLLPILVGGLLLNIGIQGAGVLTQARLLALTPDARSRLNTALVTSNFVFGAAGSALAAALWGWGGWSAVVAAGVAILGLGLVAWAGARRSLTASH
ncbi:hypothetical protein [Propioniciclava sp.]|uniref:hypothetical protein n=1 Tax=Propioniciclava sp. TaxID=2038686 RepID=UPI0026191CF6|nr:hypothetical protein [Propioniciclava sp.]